MKQNEEQGLKKYLTSEVKFIVYILGIGFGVISPYFGIKQDIALIQKDISVINSNHEVHIQDLTQDIVDLKKTQNTDEKTIAKLQEQLIAILSKK